MSSIEDYSGLCGIIPTFAGSDYRIRCNYALGHGGPCSFEKYRNKWPFRIWGGCSASGYDHWWYNKKNEDGESNGFVKSVLEHSKYDHYTIMLSSSNRIIIR